MKNRVHLLFWRYIWNNIDFIVTKYYQSRVKTLIVFFFNPFFFQFLTQQLCSVPNGSNDTLSKLIPSPVWTCSKKIYTPQKKVFASLYFMLSVVLAIRCLGDPHREKLTQANWSLPQTPLYCLLEAVPVIFLTQTQHGFTHLK